MKSLPRWNMQIKIITINIVNVLKIRIYSGVNLKKKVSKRDWQDRRHQNEQISSQNIGINASDKLLTGLINGVKGFHCHN